MKNPKITKVRKEEEDCLVVSKMIGFKKIKKVVFHPNSPPKEIDVLDELFYK